MPKESKPQEVVVKEYVERIIKSHKTLTGITTDKHIDCPKCGQYRTIIWTGRRKGYWQSCSSCGFVFPEGSAPPGPEEVEEFLRKNDEEKRIKTIAQVIQGLDINI